MGLGTMILDLNKLEDRKLRSVDYSHKFYIRYICIYNVERPALYTDTSKHLDKGDSFSLQSPLIFPAAGVQIPRVLKDAYQSQYQIQDKKQFTIDFYQVRLYTGETTVTPAELIYSREETDSGHYRRGTRYYVSTDGDVSSVVTVAPATAYVGDALTDEHPRVATHIDKDTDMLPGMFFHTAQYLGYQEYS